MRRYSKQMKDKTRAGRGRRGAETEGQEQEKERTGVWKRRGRSGGI